MTKIFAHRGCTANCRENTRDAFATALACGVGGVEFDVRLSRDLVPMVLHDEHVDRTSTGSGAVSDLTCQQLRMLDAGYLSLDEVLDLLGDRLEFNVHLKPSAEATESLVTRTVQALTECGRLATAYITADAATLRLARAVQRQIRVCCLVPQPRNTAAAIDAALAVGSCNMQVGHQQINAPFVQLAHERSLPIHAMYLGADANDPAEIRRLLACGVDGLLLDHAESWLAAGSP